MTFFRTYDILQDPYPHLNAWQIASGSGGLQRKVAAFQASSHALLCWLAISLSQAGACYGSCDGPGEIRPCKLARKAVQHG